MRGTWQREGEGEGEGATTTPIIGPFLHRFRQMIHEVVVFYVNKLASQQIEINKHLLRAVSILGEEIEKMQEEEA